MGIIYTRFFHIFVRSNQETPSMNRLITVWALVRRYKYILTILFFLVVIGFVGEDSLWARHERKAEIDRLKMEYAAYQAQYDEDTRMLNELDSNPKAVERVARERYHMKRANEDVFLFVGEPLSTDSLP